MTAHVRIEGSGHDRDPISRQRTFGAVEEFDGTVAFLRSPDAAPITGAAITVDGGWTAQ